MSRIKYQLHANPIVKFLGKDSKDFTKEDIICYILENEIPLLDLHYVADDGRLKTLNFVISDYDYLNTVLSEGERVDGSSLFGHIKAGESDLYVIPRFRTAFINPFKKAPTLSLLCSFFTKDGEPLDSAPQRVLEKATESLKRATNCEFEAMGELEYYVISKKESFFPATDQKGYHESMPFNKREDFRNEAMRLIAQCGGKIKYAHSEVGNFQTEEHNYEQNEIEMLPCPVEDAADQLVVAKWVLRNLAYSHGLTITFAPKITVGKAGSGLHIHTRIVRDGKNLFLDERKELSEIAHKTIAGYLDLAPSISAFGNRNPTSYLRLVPHQEAPTNICWGDRNRSTLVRVPLGWKEGKDMSAIANKTQPQPSATSGERQTIEYRCPDGSADIYLLLAALTVAARHGMQMDNALDIAQKSYVDIDIFDKKHKERTKELKTLPYSCYQSAEMLEAQKEVYLKDQVFTEDLIHQIIADLKGYGDKDLREEMKQDSQLLPRLVEEYFYCG